MTAQPSETLGTGLSRADFDEGRVLYTEGAPNAHYRWDAGVGIGHYLEGLRAGELRGSYCPRCERTVVPPRAFCEICYGSRVEWVKLKDTGRINTFSLCYVTWNMKKVKDPFIPAVIEIDGADPGMGILHLVNGIDPQKVKIGMAVKAVWKPESERTGAITDITHFEPTEG